ncbi:MAG: hypothetical protein V5A66_06270 [Candidatus Thermoplasmatota archaeon]
MKEKNKIRMMVVPVVAMLAVTMVVAGWQYEEQVEIEEGYDEMSIEYVGKEKDGVSFRNETTGEYEKNATAITYVDGEENYLKFDVIARDITGPGNDQRLRLILDVEGRFDQEYNLDEFMFTMRAIEGENVSRSHQDFDMGFLEEDYLDLWPYEDLLMGSRGTEKSFLGFDLEENEFSGEVQVTWTINEPYPEESHTLRLKSVVRGKLSEDVGATVDVNVQEEIE